MAELFFEIIYVRIKLKQCRRWLVVGAGDDDNENGVNAGVAYIYNLN
jgi:hypothetical protein